MKPFIVLVALSLPAVALAQGKVLKDKEQITFNEIERGVFIGAAGGPWFILNAPGTTNRPFTVGQTMRIDVGGDIGERVVAGVTLTTAYNRVGSDYLGLDGQNTGASGDYYTLAPGAAFRFNLLGFADNQDVKRTWLYVKVAANVVFYFPKTLLPGVDFMLQPSVGVEYFTRLRHFSIGLEATFVVALVTSTFGFTLTPTLRYSF